MDNKVLTIDLNDSWSSFKYYITYVSDDDYNIIINTTPDGDYSSIISSRGDIDGFINNYLKESEEHDIDTINTYNYCKDHFMELLNGTEYVRIISFVEKDDSIDGTLDFQVIKDYIDHNPSIKNKKLYFDINLTDETFEELNRVFGESAKDYYYKLPGNTQLVDYETYLSTIKINEIVRNIKSLNLSPIEQVMYAYDLVRDRVYVKEDKDEHYAVSRDLSSVINGDKIVCVGFSNMFSAILNGLGIKNRCIILKRDGSSTAHERVMVYIKDEKHNIDGVYYFDPTFDCKRSIDSNDFLSSYKHFAMTRHQMFIKDRFSYSQIDCKELTNSDIEDFDRLVKEERYSELSNEVCDTLNYYARFINGKSLIHKGLMVLKAPFAPTKEQIINDFKEVVVKLISRIPAEKLLTVLFNVRAVQYMEAPDKYKLSMNELYKIFNNSEWELRGQKEMINLFTALGDNKEDLLRIYFDSTLGQLNIDKKMHKVIATRKVVSNKNNKNKKIETK